MDYVNRAPFYTTFDLHSKGVIMTVHNSYNYNDIINTLQTLIKSIVFKKKTIPFKLLPLFRFIEKLLSVRVFKLF